MKDIFTMIARVIAVAFFICTIAIIILGFKDIDSTFFAKFLKFYIVLIYLFFIYSIIVLFINIKGLKWKKTSKLLFRWFIWSIGLWISTVILTYLTKGELRLTDKIFNSIVIAFGSVFSGLIFGISNDD